MLPRAAELTQQGLLLVLVLSLPALLAGAAVGVLVGLFSAATQINDSALTFTPRLTAVALVLGPSVPPDAGNVLRAVKQGEDVVLEWTEPGPTTWTVLRDAGKDELGHTPVEPALGGTSFVDVGRATAAVSDYYRIKGLSGCGTGS